jgi:hypothetical protein
MRISSFAKLSFFVHESKKQEEFYFFFGRSGAAVPRKIEKLFGRGIEKKK